MTPGRKFSTSTSALAIRRRAEATAAGLFRSRTRLFLPVLSWPNEVLTPSRSGWRERIMSPSGASTLITSAPRSAKRRVQCGPAIVVVKSTTRRRSKVLVIRYLQLWHATAVRFRRACRGAPVETDQARASERSPGLGRSKRLSINYQRQLVAVVVRPRRIVIRRIKRIDRRSRRHAVRRWRRPDADTEAVAEVNTKVRDLRV